MITMCAYVEGQLVSGKETSCGRYMFVTYAAIGERAVTRLAAETNSIDVASAVFGLDGGRNRAPR